MIGKLLRSGAGSLPQRLVLVLLVVVTVVTAQARRVEAEDVEAIVTRGIELRRQGRDTDALAEFQRALKIKKVPRVQAQVALAEQALGLWGAAEDDLIEALAQESDPWIKKNRSTLHKALAVIQTHLGTLEIWGTPVGAAIFVNEKPMGALPLKKPVRVSTESVVLRARADGFLESTRGVRVPAGETVREHVELVPAAAPVAEKSKSEPVVVAASVDPTASSSGETRPSSTSTPGPAGSPVKDQSPEMGSSPSKLRPLAWIAGAGAVGGLALGVVETFIAMNKKNAFNNHTAPDPGDPAHPIKDCGTDALSAACKPLQDQYNSSVTLAIVGYAVGGALAVGSVVLYVLSSPDDDHRGDHRNVAVACLPDPMARGVSCALRF